jgi:hypothetical protein
MIESVFLTMLSIGFVSFVLGIERDNLIYYLVSILMWIVVLASHVFIQVPIIDDAFYEMGLLPVSLGFIFINIILIITHYFEFSGLKKNRGNSPSRTFGGRFNS